MVRAAKTFSTLLLGRTRLQTAMSLGLVAFVLAACGGGSAGQTGQSSAALPLPTAVQQAISSQYGQIAYLPAQTASGFDFLTWQAGKDGFQIAFGPASDQEIVYAVDKTDCSAAGTPDHVFTAGGQTINWSADPSGETAWRCVAASDGSNIIIEAGRSTDAADAINNPQGLAAAQQLADIVGSAQLIQ